MQHSHTSTGTKANDDEEYMPYVPVKERKKAEVLTVPIMSEGF